MLLGPTGPRRTGRTTQDRPPLHTPRHSFIFVFCACIYIRATESMSAQRSRELSIPTHLSMGSANLHLSLLLLGLLRDPG